MNLQGDYPVRTICAVLGCSRSSLYYQSQAEDDGALRAAIERLATEWVTYGYRRITKMLQREGWQVNHKRVQRLMREMGLSQKRKPAKPRTTDSQHRYARYPNQVQSLEISYPDQVWVADITYVHLGRGHVYLAVIMDVFTRAIRGWQLSRNLDAQSLTIVALKRALQTHCPHIHHSDQGWQYACWDYVNLLRQHEVQISMASIGEPRENGYAERLVRTLKEEEIDLSEYTDFADAYQRIGQFIEDVYMRKRIHSSLGYLTPAEFEYHYQQQRLAVVH
jgi:transposase InsO family protein